MFRGVVTTEGGFTVEKLGEGTKWEEGKELKAELALGTQEPETQDGAAIKHKIIIGATIFLCALLIIYFGMVIYFSNHFLFGSEINSVNVSGKTVEEAKTLVAAQLRAYTLDLKERGGNTEQLKADAVGLKYSSEEEIGSFKDSQNSFAWIQAAVNTKAATTNVKLTYDETLLKEQIDKLACFDSSKVVEPKNPSFQYSGNGFVIVAEVPGNKVDKDILTTRAAEAILKGQAELDLESAGVYIQPKYTAKSQKTIETNDTLNKYVSANISYTFGTGKEALDGSTINKWLAVDDNLDVKFDENKAKEYVAALANTYNTVGKTRSFKTSSGTTVNVSRGDYGWSIDQAKETQDLISAIKEGKTLTKQPAYSKKGFVPFNGSNDFGNTYVEIDMSKQHLWFYKNGSLVVEGNVVTGNVFAGHATPTGVYNLKYKQTNTTLKGADYAVPVSFWMPFNGGVGLHDASWRAVFGGTLYKSNGSHGCVNMQYDTARDIYNNIEVNTPVILY